MATLNDLSAELRSRAIRFLDSAAFVVRDVGQADNRLLPEECEALGEVSPLRQREFAAGRSCAREAICHLGGGPGPILIGAGREPLWPNGFVGSITHSGGVAAALVGTAKRYRALGLDIELHEAVSERLQTLILSGEEQEIYKKRECTAMIFSAKEAVFKALYPLVLRWLDFQSVTILLKADLSFTVSAHDKYFRELAANLSGRVVQDGRFVISIAHAMH